jgi:three-Cys-motif partner protein
MIKDFHEQPFSEATKLKLDIFRRYIREWVSVFLTESPKLRNVFSVNIFDFFAGPGRDAEGNDGSPAIIAKELKSFCDIKAGLKAQKPINLFFNDIDNDKICQLKTFLKQIACKRDCCRANYSSWPFSEALDQRYSIIHDKGSANLVILDQFGISDVTPDAVKKLAACAQTDILFFIPSSYLHRFQKHPAFVRKFDLRGQNLDYNTIRRFICDYFKEKLGNVQYYLAPFSIKTGRNIHGIIFGSGNLLGLEKFLRICWDMDAQTGEANFNIDSDLSRDGQQCLIPEMNTFRKIDQFEKDLKGYIQQSNPDNKAMYQFCLEKGFPPKESKKVLDNLQETRWLSVVSILAGEIVRKGAFYLNSKEIPRIRFQKVEGAS